MTDYHRAPSDCGPKFSTDGCKSHRPKWQLQQQQQSLAEWPANERQSLPGFSLIRRSQKTLQHEKPQQRDNKKTKQFH